MASTLNMLDPVTFLRGHPHALYDALRTATPVSLHPGTEKQPPFWLLTRYDDIEKVSRNNRQFSSARGARLPTDRKLMLHPDVQAAVARSIIGMDPPEHAAYRKFLNPSFYPTALKLLDEAVHRYIADLVDSFRPGQTIEFVRELAAIVPIKTLCRLLGIPQEDEDKIFRWTNRLVGVDDPEYASSLEETNEAYREVFEYGRWLIEQRRNAPTTDLMSVVANAVVDGSPIEGVVRDGFCTILIAAGNETTRNSLSGSIWELTNHPTERAKLLARPEIIPDAIEEFLRHVTPVIQMMRTALEDVEIGGQQIKAGQRVVMLYGAANHDPAVFQDPHQLDVTRPNAKKHLAFGIGIHYCLGARLATMQLRSILAELLKKFPKIEAVDAPSYMAGNFVLGVKTLPVRLH